MSALFPILETLLKRAFWYRQHSSCFDFTFISSIVAKRFPFIGVFSFGKSFLFLFSVGQVRWKRWLRHDYGFVFSQKLKHKHPRFVFPQFCAFLTNCFLTVRPCGKNSWCTSPLQSKKTVSKTFTFDGKTSIVIDFFSAFLEPVIPQLNLCSTHSRLAKYHSQHFKCPCTFNLIFYAKLNTVSLIHFFE